MILLFFKENFILLKHLIKIEILMSKVYINVNFDIKSLFR